MADSKENTEIKLKGKPEILQIVETLQDQCKEAVGEVKNSSGQINILKTNLDVEKKNNQTNKENISNLKNDIGGIQTNAKNMGNQITSVIAQVSNIVQTLGKDTGEKQKDSIDIKDSNAFKQGDPDRQIIFNIGGKQLIIKTNISTMSRYSNPNGNTVKFTEAFPNNCIGVFGCGYFFVENKINHWGLCDITTFGDYAGGFSYNGTTNRDDEWYAMRWIAIGY